MKTPDPASERAWIAEIIDDFLEKYPKADTRSGKLLLLAAKGHVLNEMRDWAVVESEFLIPVAAEMKPGSATDNDNPSQTTGKIIGNVKVRTVMTPVGHVFQNSANSIGGRWKQTAEHAKADYQRKDPDNPTLVIATGRNSHATTEHRHGVNVNRTEIEVGNKPVFSATKHATLSAYELHPDTIRKMSTQRREQLARDLISQRLSDKLPGNGPSGDQDADNTVLTELDKAWNEALEGIGVQDDISTPDAIDQEVIAAFIDKASTDKNFCKLLRRMVARNRAREVFLSEATGNPKILEQIKANEVVNFHSISLITPDPLRHFLAKLIPSKFRRHDELTMRREEVQAWTDLQDEINTGKCEIDQKVVKAKILTFSIGVNQLSLGSTNKLTRALSSGWDTVEEENAKNMKELIGDPAACIQRNFGGQVSKTIAELRDKARKLPDTDPDRSKINDLADEIEALTVQIAELWQSGDYQRAGDQPYKFAARLTRLSELLDAAKAFSCKSGKDRSAQLELEAKLLAAQSEFRAHQRQEARSRGDTGKASIPPPYEGRTDTDRFQLLAFIFKDRSRTTVQRYNTGVEGSKLSYWRRLYESFIPASEDSDAIGKNFRGRSMDVPS